MCWPCKKKCCPSNKADGCGCDRCPDPNCWTEDQYWNWEKADCPDPVLFVAQQAELFDAQRELF